MKSKEKIAGLIMTGGKNSRMGGEIKLFLKVGEKTFFQKIMEAMDGIPEIYLSVNTPEPYEKLGLPMVIDEIAGIGPMGGLLSAMRKIDAEALLVVASDMPFVSQEIIGELIKTWEKEQKCCVVRTLYDKKVHPLLAIYPRSILPIVENRVKEENYRMMSVIQEAGVQYVDLGEDDQSTVNVNSREDYQTFIR